MRLDLAVPLDVVWEVILPHPNLSDLVGKPFEDRGRGPDTYDCLGLTIEVFKRFGIPFPNYDISAKACELVSSMITQELKILSDQWQEIKKPEVPCLVVMKFDPMFAQHLGVYISKGKFIHSAVINKTRKGVKVDSISHPTIKTRIKGFYKYVGE